MTDLIKRAAECECPPNMGCNVSSDHCRCELIEDMVNRIETLEAALLEEKDSAARYDCVVDVLSGRIKTLEAALREIAATSKIMAKGEDMETALKVMLSSHRNTAIAALAGEKKE